MLHFEIVVHILQLCHSAACVVLRQALAGPFVTKMIGHTSFGVENCVTVCQPKIFVAGTASVVTADLFFLTDATPG